LGARGKVNPPIRPDQKEAIWEKLLDGDVAFVSSDHCSWPLERKPDDDIFQAAPGAPGVECLLPVLADEAVDRRGLKIDIVVDMLCTAPARHFGLYPRKGVLKVGADADIVVLRRDRNTVDETKLHCELAPWSPYHGREIGFRIGDVWLRGTKIFDGTDVLSEPGTGRFVRPS
jgi:allantoinase